MANGVYKNYIHLRRHTAASRYYKHLFFKCFYYFFGGDWGASDYNIYWGLSTSRWAYPPMRLFLTVHITINKKKSKEVRSK